MIPTHAKPADRKTRGAIVHLLKTEGALTSAELADRLKLTAMAVRQHLYALTAERMVSVEERPVPIGRPAKYWQLTPDANRLFPDAYAELNISLITAMGDAFGEKGLKRVLDARGTRQQAAYAERIASSASLKQKLQQLARIRTEEGYMAEVGVETDGSFLLIENHCPICAAATVCQGFCVAELDLFRKLLGSDVSIEREEHIISGARRCVYRIRRNGSPVEKPAILK
jgi:predicted ArsR family transcriptional regulator